MKFKKSSDYLDAVEQRDLAKLEDYMATAEAYQANGGYIKPSIIQRIADDIENVKKLSCPSSL